MKKPFRDLPAPLQDLMVLVQKEPSAEFRAIATEGGGGKIVAVVFGALIALGVLGASILIEETMELVAVPFVFVGALLGTSLVIYKLARFRAYRRSRIRPGIIASPVLLARFGLENEDVEMHYHKDLQTPQITHHHYNGAYTHTSFNLQYSTGSFYFQISNRAQADDLLQFLSNAGDILRGWQSQGTLEKNIPLVDWIGLGNSIVGDIKPDVNPKPFLASGLGKFILSAAAAGLITGIGCIGNWVQNEMRIWQRACRYDGPSDYQWYMDRAPLGWYRAQAEERKDHAAFRQAKAPNTAGALRTYVRDYPKGRHVAEAKEGVRELYRKAETAYLEKSAKAIPAAHDGMKALLAHLREQDSPAVNICFAPSEGTDGKAFEEVVREETKSEHIHPLAPSFTAEANRAREGRIVGIMGASFNKVLSDDLFALSATDIDKPGPRFLVKYKVVGQTFYILRSEEHLPAKDKQIWVGIRIDFTFSLQVPGSAHPPDPDPAKGYAFTMAANPAPEFNVSSENPAPGLVYDRMVETAFEQFEVNLANSYGLELVMPSDWGGAKKGYDPLGGWKPPKIDIPRIDLPKPAPQSHFLTIYRIVAAAAKESPQPTEEEVILRVKKAVGPLDEEAEKKLEADVKLQWTIQKYQKPKKP